MKKVSYILIATLTLVAVLAGEPARSATYEELQKQIEEKTKAAQSITDQIQQTQQQLAETQSQKNSLQRELKKIDYSINQLNLNIKASQINIEKLNLELEGLQLEIAEINNSIGNKKATIVELLRALYQKDRQGLLSLILRNKSLAASFQEKQTIDDLNAGLALELQELKSLNEKLNVSVESVSRNKKTIVAENAAMKTRRSIVEDQKSERKSILVQTQSQERVYQEQLSELEKKQEELSVEIEKIEEELRRDFNSSLLPAPRHGMFSWPVENPRFTQHYGAVTRHKGRLLYGGKPHNGSDFGVPIGTRILAVDDGVVSAVGNNDQNSWRKYQYGKYVLIKHGNNLSTLYAHLSRQAVSVGDVVTRGQVIGYSGNTGYSTGPHLHLGAYWTPSILMKSIPPAAGLVPVGVVINPEDYLPSH